MAGFQVITIGWVLGHRIAEARHRRKSEYNRRLPDPAGLTPLPDPTPTRQPSLAEIALVFLKFGTIAFGGPAAHIAMMEEQFVRRRQWITEAEFLDRLAAANLIPGPSSTEMTIFIGQLKRGWRGLLVAGTCFLLPAAILVSAIAWAYVRYGALPQVAGMLYAIKPVVVGIVMQALWKLSKTGVRTKFLAAIAALAAALNLLGLSPIVILLIAGTISAAALWLKMKSRPAAVSVAALPKFFAAALTAAATVAALPFSLGRLFFSFLKIGSVIFGSGYVLLAFLQSEFVERLHWLTEKQLIDAVAVGQFTPGPVFSGSERAAAPADSPLAGDLSRARRGGCRLARADGRGDLATREGCDRGSDDDCRICVERGCAAAFPRELGLADRGRGRGRVAARGRAVAAVLSSRFSVLRDGTG